MIRKNIIQATFKKNQFSNTEQQITFQKICVGFCLNFWRKSSGIRRHKVSLFLVNQSLKDNITKLSVNDAGSGRQYAVILYRNVPFALQKNYINTCKGLGEPGTVVSAELIPILPP